MMWMATTRPAKGGRGLTNLLLVGMALALSACAHQPAKLQIPVPQSLREPCERLNPESVQTVGDLAAYSIRQDAAIKTCSSRGDALVELIDAANGVKAKRWWPF